MPWQSKTLFLALTCAYAMAGCSSDESKPYRGVGSTASPTPMDAAMKPPAEIERSPAPSASPSPSASASPSVSQAPTASPAATSSPTLTPAVSSAPSASPTANPTATPAASPTASATASPTGKGADSDDADSLFQHFNQYM